jgi:hypothetical protein
MDKDDLTITIDSSMLSIDTTTDVTYNVGDITITGDSLAAYDGMSWTSINDLTIDTINLDDIMKPVEFEDHMPDVAKVEDMCNEYPALAKAYENFKSIYKIVHQDWVGKQKKDELPF